MSVLLLLSALLAAAQGTETKRKASEFPVQVKVAGAEVAAEFMVRLISYGRESFVTDNFLVVEVAIYPEPGKPVEVKLADFSLRVSGKKELLLAQPPALVLSYLRYPDWERPPVRAGSADVEERFPGDPRARRYPGPPAPAQNPDAPVEERMSNSDVVNKSSLPEGPRKTPVSGFLFFPWKGNPAKLKSAELVTTLGSGDPVVIRLR